jgi:predicted NAD/FAD-binding protein
MIADILRFNARSREVLATLDDTQTLGEYLDRGGYSRQFVEHYVVPMGRAIWSAEASAMLGFPARFFVDFFDRHGFLSVNERPVWQTVRGGSREYVRALLAAARIDLRLATPVESIQRRPDAVRIRTRRGEVEAYDQVFLPAIPTRRCDCSRPRRPRRWTCCARSRMRRTRSCCTPTSGCCRGERWPVPHGTTTCSPIRRTRWPSRTT